MSKIVLCDLDGTLSDTTHRLHHIRGRRRDYDAFFAASGEDEPIEPVIELVNALKLAGKEIHIITGRREDTREITEAWLELHDVSYDRLLMRPESDRTPDHVLKRHWFESDYDPADILLALEDRDRVVQMYRELGITCLQVAEGDF